MFKTLLNNVLDLLLPQKPLVRELLKMSPDEFAERAGRTLENAGKNIISLYDYRAQLVREAVWMLKYRGNKKIAALLAALLYDELLAFLEEYAPLTHFTNPLLVPIPLSSARRRKRGFNQCELLCNELIRLDSPFIKGSGESASRGISSPPILGGVGGGISLTKGSTAVFGGEGCRSRTFTLSLTALRKLKDTQSQTRAESRALRLQNLADCFAADREAVRGRNIILIDDVATTGATLAEARRTLRRAGARKVIAFTIAH